VSVPSPRPSAEDAPAGVGLAERPLLKPGAASRSIVSDAHRLRKQIDQGIAEPDVRRRAARGAYEAVRDELVRQQLNAMPIDRLKQTTQGRLMLTAVERGGYRTVGAAAAAEQHRLQQLHGVGPQTASKVIAAARQVEQTMKQEIRVRFDPDRRPKPQARLLAELHAFDLAESSIAPVRADLADIAGRLDLVLGDASRAASRMRMFFSGAQRRDGAREALARLDVLMASPDLAVVRGQLDHATTEFTRPPLKDGQLWQDYEERPVVYNGLLIEIGGLAHDVEAGQGYLPADLATRVREHPLDTTQLKVSLRGYQAFGAKFALAQVRTILGDEMGLGKTIEALAAMCHLRSEGGKHFLVVCPASVLVSWAHEIRRHSELDSLRVHGLDRDRNLLAWQLRGGVAVTTYESLRSIRLPAGVRLAMLVADEAHYVKNPSAERTKAVRSWLTATERALFLTGTPMENRVEEFRSLVNHLRPDVAARIRAVDGLAGPTRFRQAVAPVYLRRNQTDVLDELPPRIETEEWIELDGPALAAYRDAVASGNFMAMRRAAYSPGTTNGSSKLGRLAEIVDEASANGRKVVVFSYFLDVLHSVAAVLGDVVVGPLTGSVPPVKRQGMVDEFSARRGSAVLVSQIQAGGVGLNIQAASVVILTEPQWKPTIEDQAIARCHRMGQIRTVDVHRLLAENSVDQRMLEILATKAILFDEYVRRSELKEMSPDAVDVSDLKATKDTVSQMEAEHRIVEMERKRLKLEADEAHSSR